MKKKVKGMELEKYNLLKENQIKSFEKQTSHELTSILNTEELKNLNDSNIFEIKEYVFLKLLDNGYYNFYLFENNYINLQLLPNGDIYIGYLSNEGEEITRLYISKINNITKAIDIILNTILSLKSDLNNYKINTDEQNYINILFKNIENSLNYTLN